MTSNTRNGFQVSLTYQKPGVAEVFVKVYAWCERPRLQCRRLQQLLMAMLADRRTAR